MKRIAVGFMCFTPSSTRVERTNRVLSEFERAGFAVKRFDSNGDWPCGENARRAWDWASRNGQYAMVVQDDAEPCQHAAWAIDHLTRLRPNSVMTLLDWTRASEDARAAGVHWLVGGGVYATATIMPSAMTIEMLAWLRPRLIDDKWPVHDDYTIGVWLKHGRRRPIKVYTPVPCIFQHAEPSTSTLGQANKNRVCRWVVDDSRQRVWDIDWRLGLDNPIRSQTIPYDPKTMKSLIKY